MLNMHTHSEYSKDAFSKVREIAQAHKDMGTDVFCITDHGTMSAFPTAFSVAKELDMRFAPGCEIYLTPPKEFDSQHISKEIAENNRLAKLKRIDPEVKQKAIDELARLKEVDAKRNFHMTLIAKNQAGLKNLFRMYSESEMYYVHRIEDSSVFNHKEGIIVLSGCLGSELCYYVKTRQIDRAEELMIKYKAEFGDDYYAEIMHHGVVDIKEGEKGYMTEKEIYSTIIKLAKKHDIPLITTNDSHYTFEEDSELHSLYRDIIFDKTAADNDASETQGNHGDGYFVISESQMEKRLIVAGYEQEDVDEMLRNVNKVESEIEYGIDIESPKDLKNKEDELHSRLMEKWESMRKGTKYAEESLERLKYEMKIIADKNFTAYFVNMQDIVDRAHEIGLLTGPGRGSAAGSEIAYLLGITNTDPLYYGLLFERFLNPSRSEMPDIDLDIMSVMKGDTRLGSEILTESLQDKFNFSGRINNTVKSSTLMLFKKLCTYFDVPFYMANKITTSNNGKDMLASEEPPSHAKYVNVINSILGRYDDRWDNVYRKLGMCYRLNETVVSFSIHASGVIMTEDDMVLPRNSEGVIDFNGESLEDYEYIKYDLLSLDALNAIHDIYGLDIDWEDNYDPKVWDMIGTGELDFIFQLAGFIPRKMAVEGKPRTIEEIAEISAINRPGPLNMNLNTIWVDIRNGKHTFKGAELAISQILKNAFGEQHSGLLIYQEDVMRVFVDAAGFSLAEAENVRKAMGRKDEEIMMSFKEHFMEGWAENEYDEDPEEIWGMLYEFSKYAFNKSHAVSYSQISYMNAKMWTYRKEDYIKWLLNNAPKKKQEALKVARDNGYSISFPDYTNTVKREGFDIVGSTIYAPMDNEAEFETASDFMFSSMTKQEKNKLILAGVLDSVSKDRMALFNIVKNIPDKKLNYPGFPSVNSLPEILENGELAKLWSYEESDEDGILDVTVNRARSVAEVKLHTSPHKIPEDTLKRVIKADLSNFGVAKPGILDMYPEIDKQRAFGKYYKIRDRMSDKMSDDTPELEVNKMNAALKKEYNDALRHPDIARVQSSLEDQVFVMYLTKANYFKNYNYLLLEGLFENGVFPFYIRDRKMIEKYQSLSKGSVIKMRLKMDSYMNKHKEPIVLMKIQEIL